METIDVFDSIAPLTLWKDSFYTKKWKEKSVKDKVAALTVLAYRVYYETLPSNDTRMLQVINSNRYAYHPGKNVILMNSHRASILSVLHEVGHAIHGESELDACAYSIKLFAKVFPTEFKHLEWHGHMLKRKQT